MKLLITGGSGFVGTNLIEYILDRNNDIKILNVDSLVAPACQGFDFIPFEESGRYVFQELDLHDEIAVRELLLTAQPTHIIHLATAGIQGLKNLLSYSNTVKHFIYLSPPSVVGHTMTWKDEYEIANPITELNAWRIVEEAIVREHFSDSTKKATIVRTPALFGKYQQLTEFVPRCIASVLNKKQPEYNPNADAMQWMFVNDACAGLVNIITKEVQGMVHLVQDLTVYEQKELVTMICERMQFDFEETLSIDDLAKLPFHYKLKSTRIDIEFEPTMPIGLGLDFTINWYKKKVFFEE